MIQYICDFCGEIIHHKMEPVVVVSIRHENETIRNNQAHEKHYHVHCVSIERDNQNEEKQGDAHKSIDISIDDALFQQKKINDVFQKAVDIGIPNTSSDMQKCELYIADYGAEPVSDAIKIAGDAPASARSWRYIEAILRNHKEKETESNAEKERSRRILEGDYGR